MFENVNQVRKKKNANKIGGTQLTTTVLLMSVFKFHPQLKHQ